MKITDYLSTDSGRGSSAAFGGSVVGVTKELLGCAPTRGGVGRDDGWSGFMQGHFAVNSSPTVAA